MQPEQPIKQFVDRIDTLVDATDQANHYNDLLLDGFDNWFAAAAHLRDNRRNLMKRFAFSVAIFVAVFLFSDSLIAQPDYKTHYSSQPCDVDASVRNIHNLLAQ